MSRALDAAHRVLIWCENEQSQRRISDALWSDNPASFLPHGLAQEPHAAMQPMVLSCVETSVNRPDLLVVTHGAVPDDANAYSKILDIFDGRDEQAVLAARARWKHYKTEGHPLQYIKQQPGGGWKIESESAQQAA